MSEQFTPKLIDNFEKVNQKNIETFKKHGVKNPDEIRHKCVLCGRDVSTYDSMSCKGDRLICMSCYYDKSRFPDPQELTEWVHPFLAIK